MIRSLDHHILVLQHFSKQGQFHNHVAFNSECYVCHNMLRQDLMLCKMSCPVGAHDAVTEHN